MASKSEVEAGAAFVRVFLKDELTAALARTMKAGGESLVSFGEGAMKFGAVATAGGLAMLAPIVAGVQTFTAMGGASVDAAARTGLSVGALSELGFAAKQTGAEMGDVEIGMKKMAGGIQDLAAGAPAAAKSFSAIELAAKDLQGLSPESQLELIGKRIAAIQDPSLRAALAVDMFGRSGTRLLPMLADLDGLRRKARALGIVMSTEDANAADDLGDLFDQLKAQAAAAFFQIGKAVAGPLKDFSTRATEIGVSVIGWVKANAGLIQTVAKIGIAVTLAGGAIVGLGGAIYGIGKALVFASSVVGLLGSPLAVVSGLLIGGAAAWLAFTSSGQRALGVIRSAFGPTIQIVQTAIEDVMAALKAGDLTWAARRAFGGLKDAATDALAGLGELLAKALGPVWPILKRITVVVAPFVAVSLGIMAATKALLLLGSGLAFVAKPLIFLSSMFSGAVKGIALIGPAFAFLLNPVTLITAALVGGAYAWLTFTESGQAALAAIGRAATAVVDAFTPMVGTIGSTLRGVVDALMGGDLSAAGQIAGVGLRLAFLEGIEGLAGLMPEALQPVADAILKIGGMMEAGQWEELGKLAMEGLSAGFDWAMAEISANWDTWLTGLSDALYSVMGKVWDWWSDKIKSITMKLMEALDLTKTEAQKNQESMGAADEKVKYLEDQIARMKAGKEVVRTPGENGQMRIVTVEEKEQELVKAKRKQELRRGTTINPNAMGDDERRKIEEQLIDLEKQRLAIREKLSVPTTQETKLVDIERERIVTKEQLTIATTEDERLPLEAKLIDLERQRLAIRDQLAKPTDDKLKLIELEKQRITLRQKLEAGAPAIANATAAATGEQTGPAATGEQTRPKANTAVADRERAREAAQARADEQKARLLTMFGGGQSVEDRTEAEDLRARDRAGRRGELADLQQAVKDRADVAARAKALQEEEVSALNEMWDELNAPAEGAARPGNTGTAFADMSSPVTLGPSYNASALAISGQLGSGAGGSPQEKMATSIHDMADELREMGLLAKNQDASNKQVVTMYERFLAAFAYG